MMSQIDNCLNFFVTSKDPEIMQIMGTLFRKANNSNGKRIMSLLPDNPRRLEFERELLKLSKEEIIKKLGAMISTP
jgi:hypothetical protein